LAELDHLDRAIDGALEIPTVLFKAKTALDASGLVDTHPRRFDYTVRITVRSWKSEISVEISGR
jgi:hypothetical protein